MLQRFQNLNHVLFSDETHFHLSGYVNKQNCRYWAAENSKLKHQRPLQSLKVTVWAAMSSQRIVGPYFFENENGQSVTVNTLLYLLYVSSDQHNNVTRVLLSTTA